ncbi:MAG: alpha/beta fold hydrolase [Burkholderiaceae bacterium]|nr:alpha/beta fold hydrolase [Burkholderiaceae bacterium]
MIAALQRLFSMLWAVAFIAAALGSLLAEFSAATAVSLLIGLSLGHALVLGAEMIWMQAANRSDSVRPAKTAELLKAWFAEVLHAPLVFFWRQPWRCQKFPNSSAAQGPRTGERGLVLVHGFFCNRGLWQRWMERCQDDGIPCIAVTLEPAFGSIDDYVATIQAAVTELTCQTGLPPVVVAHSMGGLAVRRWWCDVDSAQIHRLITLGTPHRGTRLARLGHTRNARQMREDSLWLAELNAREQVERRAKILCVYSHCDNIVFPASRALLPGAASHHLPATPHVAMVDHPAVWQLARESLRV